MIWIELEGFIVVKLKYFVNLFCFSSLCRRSDDRMMRFDIANQRLISGRFICLTSSSSMANHFDCSFDNPVASS